nr:hypothetical protein Iba_scaffold9249CG0020 [Ipomoea batatas]GME12085.1 hypothetical protein Iba_scaffold13320CG0020 [Ipomoea batatas]
MNSEAAQRRSNTAGTQPSSVVHSTGFELSPNLEICCTAECVAVAAAVSSSEGGMRSCFVAGASSRRI